MTTEPQEQPRYLVRHYTGKALRFQRGSYVAVPDSDATRFKDKLKAYETTRQSGLEWKQFEVEDIPETGLWQ